MLVVPDTWAELLRRLCGGFGWGFFFSLCVNGQACELGYSALRCVRMYVCVCVCFFSFSPSVALCIHRSASSPLFATLTQPKILEQKKQLPWSFAETALSRWIEGCCQLAWMKMSMWGCHQWPAGNERDAVDSSETRPGLSSKCY